MITDVMGKNNNFRVFSFFSYDNDLSKQETMTRQKKTKATI